MRQIILDTETTGLETQQDHRIIEIGCVEMVDRRFTGNNFLALYNFQLRFLGQVEIDPGSKSDHTEPFSLDKVIIFFSPTDNSSCNKPSYLSKLNTFTQLSLVVIILGQRSFGLDYPQFTSFMIYATAITTILSGLHYAWIWLVKEEVELIDSNRKDRESS